MGISNKSKKSDKETQSPVLKLFRDMMQREKHDPEKTNLLKNKGEKKKKKHSGSRSKSNKSIPSSCSERQGGPYRGNQSLLNAQFDSVRAQSNISPFQGEKRESWWFWGDAAKPVSEETCSCVSCALKKLINTDYACICCLILLFTVSVLVAFLLVYKSIPCLTEKLGSAKSEAERPKRKIEGLSKLRWDQLGKSQGVGIPDSLDETNIRDLASLVDMNSELEKLLDSDLMNEIQNSDKLREFYKKLIKTDAQIQNLKKMKDALMLDSNNIDHVDKYPFYPERAKRSLKVFHKPFKLFHFKRNKHTKGHKLDDNDKNNENKQQNVKHIEKTTESKPKAGRIKRFDNTSEPEGFLIENKKVMVRYKPGRMSKCSHTPKDSKSHETQLKHPFYQNTQRLDELLDRFLGKNLPDLLDPFGLDLVVEKEKKCKHPKLKEEETKIDDKTPKVENKEQEPIDKGTKTEVNTVRDLFDDLENSDGKQETVTKTFGMMMSVSTMMYPENNKIFKKTSNPLSDRVPARKLLQTDADDDVNEVIVDARDAVDANDPEDRRKRMDSNVIPEEKLKNRPASIINPNWKGAMPLYPEELNSMIKQDTRMNRVDNPLHNAYNPEQNEEPVNSEVKYNVHHNLVEEDKEDKEPINSEGKYYVHNLVKEEKLAETDEYADLNDMDYIEDYFRNKYDRLVEMAQAYSDYGVLEGKKSTGKVDDKMKPDVAESRIKLSLSGIKNGFKNSIFGRSKKGSNQDNLSMQNTPASEGFRLEFQPTSSTRDDNPTDFYKSLQKHLKFSNVKSNNNFGVSELDLIYTPKTSKCTKKNERSVLFSLGKGKRTLKSTDDEPEYDSKPINDFTVKNVYDEIGTDTTVEIDEFTNVIVAHLRSKREDVKAMDVSDKAHKETNTSDLDALRYSDRNVLNDVNSTINKKFGLVNDSHRLNSTDKDYKSENMTLSNFFMLLSNWFSALDGGQANQTSGANLSAINNNIESNNSDITYPMYDSDMIENIGHRSRVLLSVDGNVTAKDDKVTTVTDKPVNITKDLKTIAVNKTKTIVKRDIDDSNLIFWNDLYDDEYGVVDNFENIREKNSVRSDFIKRPNDWIREKVRKITDGFHKKAERLKGDGKRKNKLADVKLKQKAALNRFSRNADENTAKTDFAALTENMKKICKKAAKDVELANKFDVKHKEGQATSTLMQQLVRMMGDLVDYQVRQRTCRKLPDDLQNFLEWLTAAPETDQDKFKPGYKTDETNVKTGEENVSDAIPMDGVKPDAKPDCHKTLQSVEDLMKLYEDMTDDDKSKMTGVKEYLENQIEYLKRHMTSVNDFNLYNTDQIRFRRDLKTQNEKPKKRRRFKHFFTKLMKKFGKQRTNDKVKNNGVNKKVDNGKVTVTETAVEEITSKTVKEKRNLRDIYYKAVEDAKRLTTVKNN